MRRCGSGAYRITAEAEPPYGDVAPFAAKPIATNAGHLVWDTDWPDPANATPMFNDGALRGMFGDWFPDTAMGRPHSRQQLPPALRP